ncbi:MAG TPA: DUF817 domain-containing protein [Rhodoblastus sp.]|nr:DUF817 domain-containing protein [Rhodoblastus sp.]
MNDRAGDRLRSAAETFPPLRRFVAAEARLAARARSGSHARLLIYEFLRFGFKQAVACVFGGLMVALMLATHWLYPRGAGLARSDFLFLAALAIQVVLIWTRFESLDEAKVIFIFHVVGTLMEVFKTAQGSWIYPDAAFFRIGGAPLFTGFMYAAIGSYMMRAWSLFDFRFLRHPPLWRVGVLAAAIYANFFTHHWLPDMRYALFAACGLVFGRSWIYYRVHHSWRRMPMLLAAFLAALFIWFAENIGTYTQTWLYPAQRAGWSMVGLPKLGSWFLLQIVSYALVALVRRPETPDAAPVEASRGRHARRMAR